MKIKLIILLSILTSLYSCQKDKVYGIKEIYYRPITAGASYSENQSGKVEDKSTVLIIFENDSGITFNDKRDVTKIDEIIKSKIDEINSGVDILSKLEIIHPIKRKRIDNNNSIITIKNRTTDYNIIYKCNLTKNNELQSKLYLMDKVDTVAVCESGQGNDTTGIYYFKNGKKLMGQ
ncbi:MAG: hypothetical protein IPL10_16045 [Bacteroidetes bacterium]|nr:hypothetical protein [Bacteroidota bacterium]